MIGYPMQRSVPWKWALLCATAILVGCASTGSSSRIERITLGSGGGISGMQSGFRIERSGMIEEWEMHAGATRIRATAKYPASSVRRFFTRAEELRLDTLRIDEPGNMTWWLELSRDGTSTRLRWTNRERLPAEVASLVDDMQTFCAGAISGR
jgi:hypothetical protein